MRKAWTDHVAEVRRKGNRGKKTMSHREAMQAASKTWPKMKAKLIRKKQRESGASTRAKKVPVPDKNDESQDE